MAKSLENYEVLFAVYDTEDGAAGAVQALRDMDKAKTIDIIDAATLVKDADGNTTVKQEALPSVKKGLGVGALIGGAIGLLFPPSILGAAAIGAGVGAGSAKLAKMALENDDLKTAAESLEPGTSAFIAVVENTWVEQLQTTIAGYSRLAEHTVDAEAAGVIGTLETEDGSVVYGQAASDEGAIDFSAATDGNVVAAQASAALVGEDGEVVAEHVEGVAAVDDEGNVAMIGSDTVAAVDAEGNAAVVSAVGGGVIPADEDGEADDDDEEADDDA